MWPLPDEEFQQAYCLLLPPSKCFHPTISLPLTKISACILKQCNDVENLHFFELKMKYQDQMYHKFHDICYIHSSHGRDKLEKAVSKYEQQLEGITDPLEYFI